MMRINNHQTLLLAFGAISLLATSRATAELLPSLETAAARLQAATVTVRVVNAATIEPAADNRDQIDEANRGSASTQNRVTVCSGVAVARNLVVTPIYAASDSQIRITLAGGQQSTANVRVIDEYSGLALLETDTDALEPLAIAGESPNVGSWVLSAAAWGTEQPLVSVGIVSGIDRSLAGTTYPPLLQCDLRVADTSSGAGVVDREGRLIGVVIVADIKSGARGWTFAIPARHVERLLRMKNKSTNDDSITVLRRRRPVVGMLLDGTERGVVVARVDENSPAKRAGIKVGDRVVAADGVTIRSVYQAVRPVLNKQPGDKMEFVIERADTTTTLTVVLGGGIELPSAPFANLRQFVQPKVDIADVGGGLFSTSGPRGTTQEVFSAGNSPERNAFDSDVSDAEKIRLLQKALDGYQNAIRVLQDRLTRQQTERQQTEQLIGSLQQQIESLKSQLPTKE